LEGDVYRTLGKDSSLILFYPQMASLLAEIIYHRKVDWLELATLTGYFLPAFPPKSSDIHPK
jgi:hypothetical protein